MTPIRKEQLQAADDFVAAAMERLQDERGLHAETIVAGTARMAGTFLFRSFDFALSGVSPGQAVLSERANDAGPALIQLFGGALVSLAVKIDPSRVKAGGKTGPQPRLTFLETQRLLEPAFAQVRAKHGLTLPEAAQSAALAAAVLVKKTASVLDPNAAFGLVVYGFIEGSKTAPDPVKS